MRWTWSTCTSTRRTLGASRNASSCMEDAIWEAPARTVAYTGRERIKEMYLRLFESMALPCAEPVERFASPDRVFDDMWVTFRLSGDGFENCPYPIGTKVKMRRAQLSHTWWPHRPRNRLRDLGPRRIRASGQRKVPSHGCWRGLTPNCVQSSTPDNSQSDTEFSEYPSDEPT